MVATKVIYQTEIWICFYVMKSNRWSFQSQQDRPEEEREMKTAQLITLFMWRQRIFLKIEKYNGKMSILPLTSIIL